MTPFDLSEKVAVVTGGNRGIGLGIVRGLAQAGAGVVVAARNEEKSRRVVREIQEEGGVALAVSVGGNRVNEGDAMWNLQPLSE